MSIAAVAWAFKCPIDDPTAKFLLVSIANYADEDGKSWPSLRRLSLDTAYDRSTVIRGIGRLAEKGYLSITPRFRPDGSHSSNLLQLLIQPIGGGLAQHPPVAENGRGGGAEPMGVVAHATEGGCTKPPLEPSLNLQYEPSKKSKKVALRAPDDWPSDFGEQFWKKYPPGRKTGKRAVIDKLSTIRRRGDVSWAKINTGLDRYIASNPDPEFTKGPLVWVNQGCWDDEITVKNGHGNGNGHAPRPGSKDDTRERTVNALRSLDPFPYSDDAGRGQGPGPQISGLLPFAKPA